MGIAVFPAASSGGIKSVQRGQAVSSGSITITAVDITKSFVRSYSEGSAGTVATNSTVAAYNATLPAFTGTVATHNSSFPSTSISVPVADIASNNNNTSGTVLPAPAGNAGGNPLGRIAAHTSTLSAATISNAAASISTSGGTITGATAAISGGTTSLTSAEYGVYLSNSTTLVASGACRWEVVEFN